MAFECSSCHNIQAIVQPQGVFTGIYLSYSYLTYLKNKKASGSECLLQMEWMQQWQNMDLVCANSQ